VAGRLPRLTNRIEGFMTLRLAVLCAFALVFSVLVPVPHTSAQVPATDYTYTTDADFDLGTLVSVNHDAPYSDQLQLDSPTEPFPFINIAASARGTVVRAHTGTGEVVGEYRAAPEGRGLSPSRTTVDLFGNVWTANRGEVGKIDNVPHGSAVKIGLIVGGTRVKADGSPDPSGDYLAPPFGYNTCVDRDGDGLIRTSAGPGDVLNWPDISDGVGGSDGLVQDAVDECILIYQRLPNAEQARHVSVDADNNVWVGGFPFELRHFYKLDGSSGAILDSFDADTYGCGGYGGLVDGNGILWSIGWGWAEGILLRYDPATRTGTCVNTYGGYGLGIDTNGYLWASIWNNGITKVSPDGALQPGFPKTTWQASTSTTTAGSVSPLLLNAKPTYVTASLALEAPIPTFWVAPNDDWVESSSPWTPGATISLTIEDGSGVVYTDSQIADSSGNFHFGFGGTFDVQRGHLVTVSDGTTTKAHTVTNLFVDGMDVTADTVFGRADAGVNVDVWVHGDGNLTVTSDGSGNWTADFSGMTDLTYLSDGGSAQYDGDGDGTGVWWAAPRFWVAPVDNWVESSGNWTPGSTVSLTIEDGSGVVYSDSQTVGDFGYFHFGLDGFDLQRGHVVTVSDGATTKAHTVSNLFVDGMSVTADTVFGRADAGVDVDLWVHGDGNLTVTSDGAGNWTADFSGMTDLDYLSDGGSAQYDGDGDATGVWWSYPRLQAAPDGDWVQSYSPWTPGATVSLTIEDGSGVVYADSQIADGDGSFHFGFGGVFDLQRGHVVTVSDGTTTKTHTVTNLFVDGMDVTADTVFGRADAGSTVTVWVHGNGWLMTTADGAGNWTADFSGLTDLAYASDGGSEQIDADGDATGVWWEGPRFQANPDFDWVQSITRWTPGATISLTVEDGSGVVLENSQTADSNGNFHFGFGGIFDLQRGHVVTVSDGTTTKTHRVIDLYADSVDVTADTVTGRAPAGTAVHVWIHGTGVGTSATADGSGNWIADFSGLFDLTHLSEGGAEQSDEDGDSTGVEWYTRRFQVGPQQDWVQSSNPWTPGATVSLTIEDGSGVVYSDSQTADLQGNFSFGDLAGFDLLTNQVVTVSDGACTKTHTVTGVTVTNINHAADTVSGTANPGAWVQASAYLFGDWSSRWVRADAGGNWMADFSVPFEGNPAFDITEAMFVDVEEYDDDADATMRSFGPPVQANRGVAVTPIDNHVWVANSGVGTVTRLDNDGNILKVIDVGTEPTGVAVDAAGKVWATNMGSDNAMRIDPSAGADGLGAVDLTVDLGPGAGPYNYSDMTGAVVVGSTSPQGFWTAIQDSGEPGFEWGRLNWNNEPEASEPAGTEIVVEIRTSDTEAGLGGKPFTPVLNGAFFSSFGRFIEVRVTLKASPGGESPVLSDIRVQPAFMEVPVDIEPTSCPNPFNVGKRGVMPVAVLGTSDFDVSRVDPASVRLEGAAPLRWAFEDVATPFEPYLGKADDYDCNEYGPDGYMDLTLMFKALEVAAALGDVADGDVLVFTLTGHMMDDTRIGGEDVIVILKRAKP
jgi:hypothetical protein